MIVGIITQMNSVMFDLVRIVFHRQCETMIVRFAQSNQKGAWFIHFQAQIFLGFGAA
jgi:hypothetical protein